MFASSPSVPPSAIASTDHSQQQSSSLPSSLTTTMVLHTANIKRVDCENTPPVTKIHGSTKSLASRIRSSIQDASRRRRARTTGSTHSPRYVVEQAKRRSATKSPAPSTVRITIALPSTPPPTTEKDVDMQGVSPSTTPISPPTTPINLPRYLARPDFREISKDAITAVDPELKDVNMDYILEGLEVLGPKMLNVLSSVQARPVKNILPKELSILVNDVSSDLPTHMFAVYSRQAKASARRRVTLFPVHNIIFSSQCANLPKLPPSPKNGQSTDTIEPRLTTVPVVPLAIPSPQTFPQLSAYLYTRSTTDLLSFLLPVCGSDSCPPPDVEDIDSTSLLQYACKMAETYTVHALLGHAMTVNGLWRNACALGAFDLGLWDSMDIAWEVIITALAIATGNLETLGDRATFPTV